MDSKHKIGLAITGSAYLAGSLIAGPVGATIAGVPGNVLSELVVDRWFTSSSRLREGEGPEQEVLLALRRATVHALASIERNWKSRSRDVAEPVTALFSDLKDLAREMAPPSTQLRPWATWDGNDNPDRFRDLLREGLSDYTYGHDEQLIEVIGSQLGKSIQTHFIEELLQSNSDGNRAWRSFQMVSLNAVRDAASQTHAVQISIQESLEDFEATLKAIDAKMELLISLPEQARDRSGEQALEELQSQILGAILDEGNTTRDTVLQSESRIRQDIADALSLSLAQSRSVQALLRGPIQALGLESQLASARSTDNKLAAASSYGKLATALKTNRFVFHARLMERLQSEALLSHGSLTEAIEVLLSQCMQSLEDGDIKLPIETKDQLVALADGAGLIQKARVDAVVGIEAWYEQPKIARQLLEGSLQVLCDNDDPWMGMVACWLGEFLLTEDQSISEIVPTLRSLVATASGSIRTRSLLLIAEAIGEWDGLVRQSEDGRLDFDDAGLVLMRYARHLALDGKAEESISYYRRAIEKLGQANLIGDASQAMFSVLDVQGLYLYSTSEDPAERSVAFSMKNGVSSISGNTRHDQAVFEHLHEGRFPEAKAHARRFLFEARSGGSLSRERYAHKLLGDVYREASTSKYGRPEHHFLALCHYVACGQRKLAKKVAACAEQLVSLDGLNSRAPWIVASTLTAISARGEVIPESLVHQYSERLINLTEGLKQGPTSPRVDVEAWNAVAATILQMQPDHRSLVLDKIEARLHKYPGSHLQDSHLLILRRIYQFDKDMRERVAGILVQLIRDSDNLTELSDLPAATICEQKDLLNVVIEDAEKGNSFAANLLAANGISYQGSFDDAAARLLAVENYQVGITRTSDSVDLTFEWAAQSSRYLSEDLREGLAKKLAAIATDTMSPDGHRSSASFALEILGKDLSDTLRTELFNQLRDAIGASGDPHPLDAFAAESLDAFSRFKLNMQSLDPDLNMLLCIASLATSIEEAKVAMDLFQHSSLRTDDKVFAQLILSLDPAIRPSLNLEEMSRSQSLMLRRLAVRIALDSVPLPISIIEALACDPDYPVRRELVVSLRSSSRVTAHALSATIASLSTDEHAVIRAHAQQLAISLSDDSSPSADPLQGMT